MLGLFSASSRPASQFTKEDFRPYSEMGDVFGAGLSTSFRASPLGFVGIENEIYGASEAALEEDAAALARWDNARRTQRELRDLAPKPEDFLPKYTDRAEIKSLLADEGIDFDDAVEIPKEGMSLVRARIYQQTLLENRADEAILSSGRPGAVSAAASLAGGLTAEIANPLNYIPIANGLNRARGVVAGTRLLSRAGLGAVARGAGRGASFGAIESVVADAVTMPLANRWGADLGWQDAVANMAVSGLFGSLLGGAGAAVGTFKVSRMHQDALLRAAADDSAGRDIDVVDVLTKFDLDIKPRLAAINENVLNAEQALVDVRAMAQERLGADPFAELDVDEIGDDLRRQWAREAEEFASDDPGIILTRLIREGGGISTDSLRAMGYEPLDIQRLQRSHPGIVRNDAMVGIDEFAANLGFDDADSLFNQLLDASTRAEVVQKYFDNAQSEYQSVGKLSFEKAAAETESQAFISQFGDFFTTQRAEYENMRIGDAEMNLDDVAVRAMIENGRATQSQIDELAAADADIAQVSRERNILNEAVECMIVNGI